MKTPLLAVLTIATLVPGPTFALTPDEAGSRAPAPASASDDLHVSYLAELEARSPAVREPSLALRLLLEQRGLLARQFTTAPASQRSVLAREIDDVDRLIASTESTLEDALARTTPRDGPYYVAPEPVPFDELRASAVRRRRPIYLPIPRPEPVPELITPAREADHLAYLAVRAGTNEFARHMVDDTARLLRERRELMYRHLRAPADERKILEIAIASVSQRLRCTTEAIRDAGTSL